MFVNFFHVAEDKIIDISSVRYCEMCVCVCVCVCDICNVARILYSDIELVGIFHPSVGWGLPPFSLRYFIRRFLRHIATSL